MGIQSRRIDLNIIKGDRDTLTWELFEMVGTTKTPYDTTGKVFKLSVFNRETPIGELFPAISPATDQGSGYVSFELQSAQTNFSGVMDYLLQEEAGGVSQVLTVAYGSITFVDLSKYVPFRDLVGLETPGGISIPEAFINAKSLEWRLTFKSYSNSVIETADINKEETWPVLYNILIAKLVVNDYLVKAMKSAMIAGSTSSSSSSSESSGNALGIKSIETGPTKVEFQDSMKNVSEFMKTSSGQNALSSLQSDICGVASTLRIKLEICKAYPVPIVPQKQGLETSGDGFEILSKYYGS